MVQETQSRKNSEFEVNHHIERWRIKLSIISTNICQAAATIKAGNTAANFKLETESSSEAKELIS